MSDDSQYLVTGATGFIGRYVTRQLLARGESVRVLSRSIEKAQRLFGGQVEIVAGDLCDPSRVNAACRGIGSVIHLGGDFRFGRRARRAVHETNVAGTQNVLNAARAYRVERFVHVSSCGVLEPARGLVTERDFPSRVPRSESYRHSKWLGERAALQAARDGLPVTIASPASPLGAEDETPTPFGQIVLDCLRNRFPATARVALNMIHVDELAAGIVSVADRGRIGERYLLSHHNLWLDELIRLIARSTGQPSPRWQMPLPLIALAGFFGELVGSARVCWETSAHARRKQWFDNSKAVGELDWAPAASIETTVFESIAWFRNFPETQPSLAAGKEVVTENVASS